jgi:hypothetical protein
MAIFGQLSKKMEGPSQLATIQESSGPEDSASSTGIGR